MIDIIDLQKRFHDHFKIQCPSSPIILDREHLKMRLNFLLEELKELSNACGFAFEASIERGITIEENQDYYPPEPEQILDALVDLQVVLLGTAQLMGFFNTTPSYIKPGVISETIEQNTNVVKHSIFEEAYLRVWIANMKKVRCESAADSKRGFAIDLKKPQGWTPPVLSDLVKGFFGPCKDCGCELQEPFGSTGELKCDACLNK